MPKGSRRQFLKMIGITPALPALTFLPETKPEPAPSVAPETPAPPTLEEMTDAFRKVLEESREAPARMIPFSGSAMRRYWTNDFHWPAPDFREVE